MSQRPLPNPYESYAFEPIAGELGVDAASQVAAPAILLIVTSIVGGLYKLAGLGANVFVVAAVLIDRDNATGEGTVEALVMFGFGIVSGLVGLVATGIVIYGAMKMRSLESYTLSMVTSVLAIVPCVSPCCLFGVPVGIWALVVLSRPEVKVAFRS